MAGAVASPSTASTAVTTTFGLPELLELILDQLGRRDTLVRANRVCREWHDAINASTRIRKKLFLPTGATPAVRPDMPAGDSHFNVPAYSVVLRPNPLLPFRHRYIETGPNPAIRFSDGRLSSEIFMLSYTHEELLKAEQMVSKTQGMMLLTDPPCATMLCRGHVPSLGTGSEFMAHRKSGLTYGDVISSMAKCRDATQPWYMCSEDALKDGYIDRISGVEKKPMKYCAQFWSEEPEIVEDGRSQRGLSKISTEGN